VNHILVAFDGSESASRAFDFGLALAAKFGARLHVLAVVRPPEIPEDVETEAMIESAREDYERQLGALQARAAKSKVDTGSAVVIGHPAEQIVRRSRSSITPRRTVSIISCWVTVARHCSAAG